MRALRLLGGTREIVGSDGTRLTCAALGPPKLLTHPLQYYECLPESAVEGLRHELNFDCPKVCAGALPRLVCVCGGGVLPACLHQISTNSPTNNASSQLAIPSPRLFSPPPLTAPLTPPPDSWRCRAPPWPRCAPRPSPARSRAAPCCCCAPTGAAAATCSAAGASTGVRCAACGCGGGGGGGEALAYSGGGGGGGDGVHHSPPKPSHPFAHRPPPAPPHRTPAPTGSYNEAEAYLYFCRAALEYLRATGRQPDVLHVHEWQAAAVAMLFWDAPPRFAQVGVRVWWWGGGAVGRWGVGGRQRYLCVVSVWRQRLVEWLGLEQQRQQVPMCWLLYHITITCLLCAVCRCPRPRRRACPAPGSS